MKIDLLVVAELVAVIERSAVGLAVAASSDYAVPSAASDNS